MKIFDAFTDNHTSGDRRSAATCYKKYIWYALSLIIEALGERTK